MSASDDDAFVPQFAHAVRGYDRYQVDEYVERLNEWAAGADERAAEAERVAADQAEEIRRLQEHLADLQGGHPAPPEGLMKEAAERAANAVALAVQQAEEIRRRAADEAQRRIEEAGRDAKEVVELARRSVAGFSEELARQRQDAHRRAEAVVTEATRRAEEIRRRVEGEAEQILADARDRGQRVVADAEGSAEGIRGRIAEETREARAALEQLHTERAEIVGELSRLRGAIQALISGAGSTAVGPGPPAKQEPRPPGEPVAGRRMEAPPVGGPASGEPDPTVQMTVGLETEADSRRPPGPGATGLL